VEIRSGRGGGAGGRSSARRHGIAAIEALGDSLFLAATRSGIVRLWDTRSRSRSAEMQLESPLDLGILTAMTAGPATSPCCLAVGSLIGRVGVWDLRYNLQVASFELPSENLASSFRINSIKISDEHVATSSGVSVDSSSRQACLWLAVGGNGGGIAAYNLEKGELLCTLRQKSQKAKLPHLRRRLLSGTSHHHHQQQERYRHFYDRKATKTLQYKSFTKFGGGGGGKGTRSTAAALSMGMSYPNRDDPKCLDVAPDGKRVVSASGNVVRIWDLQGRGRSRRLRFLPGLRRKTSSSSSSNRLHLDLKNSSRSSRRNLLEERREKLVTQTLTGGGISAVATLGPQGGTLSGGGEVVVGCKSGHILLWT